MQLKKKTQDKSALLREPKAKNPPDKFNLAVTLRMPHDVLIQPQENNPETGPVTDLESSPVDSPASGPTSSPVSSPISGPINSPLSSPVSSPASSPADNLTSSPVSSPTSGPVDSPLSGPITSPISSPTSDPASSPISSPASAPTDGPIDSPVSGPASSPISLLSISNLNSNLRSESPSSPVDSPVSTPMSSPLATPASSPASSPIIKEPKVERRTNRPLTKARPIIQPALPTTVADQDRDPGEGQKRYVSLDSTHTGSEQKIYSVMYRECITKGCNPRRFSHGELKELTGLNSKNTIVRALKGLIDKCSIEIVDSPGVQRYGTMYRVFNPKEIDTKRTRRRMIIDPKSKAIISAIDDGGSPASGPMSSPVTSPASSPFGSLASAPASSPMSSPIDRSNIDLPAGQILTSEITDRLQLNPDHTQYSAESNRVMNQLISDSSAEASSSHGKNDAEKRAKVQQLFEQLSGGGHWKDGRDDASYAEISHVSLWHIIMGLCYSVSKSPEHKMSSLAYAVPSILEHYKDMSVFPAEEMIAVAYKTMRRTMNCLATDKWTVPEWDK